MLSNKAMAAAIEANFVPVFFANNRAGRDAQVLKRFKEPAWNYQVVRFLDAEAADIIPRKDRVWTVQALAGRMIAALEKRAREVPKGLKQLAASR